MKKTNPNLYKTRTEKPTLNTRFLEDHRYVPEESWATTACSILAAGKISAAPDYLIQRQEHPGQDILYCVSGAGYVMTENRTFPIAPNQLAWIANERPHAHWPDRQNPWTVLWFRFSSPVPAAYRRKLFGVGLPKITMDNSSRTVTWFEQLFEIFAARHSTLDITLNYLIGEFLVEISRSVTGRDERYLPHGIRAAVDAMRAAPERPWRSSDLAVTARLSPAQLRRLFRHHLQSTPRQFLRRERLMRAQALLLQTRESVGEIAERCGFCDIYHFSREFRRATGISPTAWRRLER